MPRGTLLTKYSTAGAEEIDQASSMTDPINQVADSLIRAIEVMAEDRAMAYCEGFIGAGVEIVAGKM